jgi:hypothetical protein
MDARSSAPTPLARVAFVALVLSAYPCASLSAQELDSLSVGSRVRLRGPALTTQVGEIAGLTAEGLTLGSQAGEAHSFEWSELSRVDVSVGRRGNAGKGALIGLGIGVVFGAIAASGETGDLGPGFVFVVGSAVVGLPLTIVGAFVGSTIHSDLWQETAIPAVGPSGGLVLRIPH